MLPWRDIWTCILARCEGTTPSICHAVSPQILNSAIMERTRSEGNLTIIEFIIVTDFLQLFEIN